MERSEPQSAQVWVTSDKMKTTYPLTRGRMWADLTEWRDPIGQPHLTKVCEDGRDVRVREWISAEPRLSSFLAGMELIVRSFVPLNSSSFLTIGVYDKKGIWIAPAVAEILADHLAAKGYRVHVRHDAVKG